MLALRTKPVPSGIDKVYCSWLVALSTWLYFCQYMRADRSMVFRCCRTVGNMLWLWRGVPLLPLSAPLVLVVVVVVGDVAMGTRST